MMLHDVYFWMTEEARENHAGEFRRALEDLLRIEGIESGRIGTPAGTAQRPVTDHTFDYALHLEFASQAAHDVYQDHPDHHRFVDQCRAWWQRVLVYDTEVCASHP